MSYKGTKWAYEVRGLSGTEKAVLVNLGFRMRDLDLTAWPKQKTISQDTGINVRSIRRACKVLEKKGLITLVQRRKYYKVYKIEVRTTCV